jgi:hypothetical protein
MERHSQPGTLARAGGIALAALPAAMALVLLFAAPAIASVGLEQATGSVGPYC